MPIPRIRLRGIRFFASVAGALSVLAGCLAIVSASAYAHVEEVAGTKVGLQPREIARYWEGPVERNGLGESESNAAAKSFNNNPNDADHPGPVMHSVATYAVYWDPQDYYHGDWQGLIDGFLANLESAGGQLNSVFAVDEQYVDATNKPTTSDSAFHGAYTDTNPYPETENCADPRPWTFGVPLLMSSAPVCLTNKQIQAQLKTFISEQHGLPKGMGTIYYVMTPPGVTVCLDGGGSTGHCSEFEGTISEIETDENEKKEKENHSETYVEPSQYKSYKQSFCSYHSDVNPSGESGGPETILYAVIPWIAGGTGDAHLAREDWFQSYDCQDGGFEPGIQPNGELQEKESDPKEQEPNQLGTERGPDGSFDHGLADLIINQIAVEQQDTITDPLLNGWQDPVGNEVTDECRNSFFVTPGGSVTASPWTLAGTLFNQTYEGGSYYINDAFNLAALRLPYPAIPCLHEIALEPQFTAPSTANAGEIIGFDGMESNITLDSAYGFTSSGATKANYPTFTWNFGDGSPEVSGYAPGAPSKNSPESSPCAEPWLTPCAASTFHSYQYGGTYNVTLTVKDVGGNVASITEPITIVGPSPPSPEPTPGGGSSTSSPGTSSTGASSGTNTGSPPGQPAKPAIPAPVAVQAVSHTSVKKAIRKGLVVRYQVNEQVTGRFNVLLAAKLAKRIGLHLPLAHGLPAGTPPQEIVGHALLITTRGGRGTIKIKFGRVTGKRLRRLHRASLLLQLNLRNAAGGTTTVLSKIKLR
jgi:PKD domain